MKRFFKILVSVALTINMAWMLFYNMVAGAPAEPAAAERYIIKAAIFAVALSVWACVGIHYTLHLEKKLEQIEKKS